MTRRIAVIAVSAAALVATSFLLFTTDASAVPSYSRRYAMECSGCHTMWGALNGAGVQFRLSGYRAVGGRDLAPVAKDLELSNGMLVIPTTFPFSIITGVGIDARTEKREAADGTHTSLNGSSLALEDASIFLTGPLGPHLSAFIEFPMYETRAGEFLPTGPAEANDKTPGDIQFSTEKPVFEVAKFWWNSLIPSAPRDSVNLLGGITHLPLAYSPGKVRLSVNQYPVYERRALDLIGPQRVDAFLSGDVEEGLFRLSEPQILLEVNGMVVPGKAVADVGKRDTLWLEYHVGVANGSNDKADNNRQKDVYGRLIARWYNQSLGLFAYYSPDTYGDDLRAAGQGAGIMASGRFHNSTTRVGPDMTLSLVPLGIPVWMENQLLFSRESDPTGFGKDFKWTGGFDQLNWQPTKTTILYGRYDWISGKSFDDTSVSGGATKAKPSEWDVVAGVQHLVRQNVKLVAEYRHDVFEDKAGVPHTARVTTDGYTVRAMLGF